MRTPSALFAALALLVWATPASAAPMPVNGTLTVTLGMFGSVELTGSGVGSSAGGVGSAATVPAGLFALTSPLSVPITPPALGVFISAHGVCQPRRAGPERRRPLRARRIPQ